MAMGTKELIAIAVVGINPRLTRVSTEAIDRGGCITPPPPS